MEYEQRRLENIARNREHLARLGLAHTRRSVALGARSVALHQNTGAKSKRARVAESLEVNDSAHVRRSSRLAGQAPVNYTEETIAEADGDRPRRRPTPSHSKDSYDFSTSRAPPTDTTVDWDSYAESLQSLPKTSTKRLRAQTNELLQLHFGAFIPKVSGQVKGAVILAAASSGDRPTFNKYSGIVEWRNAIFLFVNIGGEAYSNVFLDKNRRIAWFAQPKQHAGTPVIQRLLGSDGAPTAEIFLFLRIPDVPAYFCAGPVTCVAADTSARPMRFTLEITRHSDLATNSDFQRILSYG